MIPHQPLDVARLQACFPFETEHTYTRRDTILYALGVGAGIAFPGEDVDLTYVDETRLRALPTMSVMLAYPGFWQKQPRFGLLWQHMLHVEQRIQLFRPLPVEGTVRGVTTLESVHDRGAEKGAVVSVRREICDVATGEKLATIIQGSLLRANGGFATERTPSARWPSVPQGSPDVCVELPTRPEQALIYRLSGDDNPLHIDPAVARQAGFPTPILHGLCTFGLAGRGIGRVAASDALAVTGLSARFTAPMLPGETVVLEAWAHEQGSVMFRCRSKERDVVVLDNGMAEYS